MSARGSTSPRRRLSSIGPAAYPSAASRIAPAPSSSSPLPAMSRPTSATTPANPISSPNRRAPVARSAWSNRSASRATISGTEAIRIAANEDETCCSPAAISGNGITISASA